MELNSFAHARGDLNCVPKVIRDCFGFTLLRSGIGPLSQPIICKTKQSRLGRLRFPALWAVWLFLFGLFGLNVFAFLRYCFDLVFTTL